MKKTTFDKCFYKCPGAWTGHAPTDTEGTITIDPARILDAAKHIKRYFDIVRIDTAGETTHPTLKTALFVRIMVKS